VDVDVLKEGIDGLIRAGYNKNRDALLEEAFRTIALGETIYPA
jgi:hypothetical protein